jgi:hypothetical protein
VAASQLHSAVHKRVAASQAQPVQLDVALHTAQQASWEGVARLASFLPVQSRYLPALHMLGGAISPPAAAVPPSPPPRRMVALVLTTAETRAISPRDTSPVPLQVLRRIGYVGAGWPMAALVRWCSGGAQQGRHNSADS